MSVEEVEKALGLQDLRHIHFKVLGCVAKGTKKNPVDRNIDVGLRWLSDSLREKYDEIDERVQRERAEEKKREDEARKKKWAEIQKRMEAEAQDGQERETIAREPDLHDQKAIATVSDGSVSPIGDDLQKKRIKKNQVIPVGVEERSQDNGSEV